MDYAPELKDLGQSDQKSTDTPYSEMHVYIKDNVQLIKSPILKPRMHPLMRDREY